MRYVCHYWPGNWATNRVWLASYVQAADKDLSGVLEVA